RAQRDHALAVDLLPDAVNRLARTAGTRAQSESGDFQRFWRDANAAAGHVVLQWEPAARGYAAAVLDEAGVPG
ncbi:hydrolase, partial [Streptomyces sp. W16]|nr:hydrolase [Streptomyces sp. W16]